MAHELEVKYGLSAEELLDALNRRFRAKVTLEGAVAEVHLKKRIAALEADGRISHFEEHDKDGYPDFTIWVPKIETGLTIECKNVKKQVYREHGSITHFMAETQKTRAAKSDPTSRHYGIGEFDILAVCTGKKTEDWSAFLFIRMAHLTCHKHYANKCAANQRVSLPDSAIPPWYRTLGDLLTAYREGLT